MAPKSRLSESAAARPPAILSPTILISDVAQLTGTHLIRVGNHTAVHPRCRINSSAGPITIGDYCILNERTQIIAPDERGIVLENYVVVETNAVVEAQRVGEGSVIEVGAKIGKGAVVGKNCKFTPLTTVADGEVVEDDTVVWGFGSRRKDMSGSKEARRKLVERQVEGLKAVIPSNRAKFMS
ncbi:trimeric LpxA-like protein [Sphaerosporella brunnea]|uniref:Dynactin subunit 6 n=1 Tax=Sphaerosporella brunnea TaxID=1250544 RepID=A0A5J5F287_9PEZI|nr:trimeric LpxA-like protein [Sphaerosporella brunnea]